MFFSALSPKIIKEIEGLKRAQRKQVTMIPCRMLVNPRIYSEFCVLIDN